MTIISKIKELKEKNPEKAALIDVKTGSRITFSQIDDKSDRICIYLKNWILNIWQDIFLQ